MSLWQLANRSLRHFWRTNLALLLGISVGTAVLTGALLVGDSIRGSLKGLTIQRLGRIDEILLSEQFFGTEMAASLEGVAETATVQPVILLNQGTIETIGRDSTARMQSVTVIGCSDAFWGLDVSNVAPRAHPSKNQIVINQAVAVELGLRIGDLVLIRVGKPSSIATDSPLARKDDLVKTLVDLEVVDIVPTKGLGRFSLQASQQIPANAFVSLETLQDGLGQSGRANAILVAWDNAPDATASSDAFAKLKASLEPQLSDLGLSLERITLAAHPAVGPEQIVAQYDTLTNERMLFTPESEAVLDPMLVAVGAQPVFTYLATKMQKVDASGELVGELVPYSTVTGIDSIQEIGPLLANQEPILIGDDSVVLNNWAADVLDASVGDRIRITYFEPETSHGETIEQHADLTVQAIVEINPPSRPFNRRRDAIFIDQPPTLANDPDLTPEVPGITDADSMASWDAPFPIDNDLLEGRDDDYWGDYRTTPKAFLSLATSRKLWQSRFGQMTSYRLPIRDNLSLDARSQDLSNQLKSEYEGFGMHWLRVKKDGLDASKGTTPFDGLFLGFSMFIIAAALMLVSLLLRLSLEQRASQVGLLSSFGFPWKRTLSALLLENGAIVLMGSLLGVLLGVAYAWLMIAGLKTWWLEAIVTPFMELTVRPMTLLLGGILGVLASLLTIFFTLRRLKNISASELLAGKTEEVSRTNGKPRWWLAYAPVALIVLALVLISIAPRLATEPQAGAFFGSGFCVLTAILFVIASRLRTAAESTTPVANLSLQTLAIRNLSRNPTRSTLTIGLVASACFLIVAISAFRLAPTEQGTGGFELVGQSDQPIIVDLQDPERRQEVFGAGDYAATKVFALRMQEGDDASCRNLYQSKKPRLIGITEAFRKESGAVGELEWAGIDPRLKDGQSPWETLGGKLPIAEGVIPVVLDKNTAMYSMQLFGGVGQEFERDYGAAGVLKFRVVGLLAGSIFQGSLLVPEKDLLAHFPRVGGFRYFLVDAPTGSTAVAGLLEDQFSDEGLDLTDTGRLLTELLAVQNTYLSTFQSLGGLGLLLGTFGLAAVQLRNVIQRRGELALLQATGFRNHQLSMLILHEHALLLFGGLAVGIVAALVVVFPHILFGGASVPFQSLLMTLGLVAIVGLASAVVAQRYLNRAPLLPALQGD